ncbi:MAG: Ig-like domain-containing protein [Methanomassiliicoccales archaeon]|nr:MAG: Ig-like domain-containing protein [Methanomassiliicoccales archaeon]
MDPNTTKDAFSFRAYADADTDLKDRGEVVVELYTLTFTLTSYSLIEGAVYIVKVESTATDKSGLPLESDGNGIGGEPTDSWVMGFLVEESSIGYSPLYDSNDGLAGDVISSMVIDSQDRPWIATGSETGICSFNGVAWQSITLPDDLNQIADIPCMAIDNEKGYLWLGLDITAQDDPNTTPKLAKYEIENDIWQIISAKDLDPDCLDNVINTIAVDSESNVWIVTSSSGILKYQNGQVTHIDTDPTKIPDDLIWAFTLDGDDNAWIGTTTGIWKLDALNNTWGEAGYVYDTINITAMVADSSGAIWVGTLNYGLLKLDPSGGAPGVWSQYTIIHGLPGNSITSLAIDSEDEYIWVGTTSGLGRCNMTNGSCIAYTGDDGSDLSEEAINALSINSRGEAWFGTDEGVQMRDDVSPSVMESFPQQNDIIEITQEIRIVFSEPMNSGATQGAFIMMDANDRAVSGKFSWSDAQTLIFDPNSMSSDQSYSVSIETSAKDLAGNGLNASYSLVFYTTGEVPLSGSGCFINSLKNRAKSWLDQF